MRGTSSKQARSAYSSLTIAFTLALSMEAFAAPTAKPLVSIGQAEHLVMAQLIHDHRNRLPGLVISVDKGDDTFPAFWMISVDWDERKNGERYGTGHYGFFAVDKMTGDVWEGTICREYRSPELARAQRQLRRRLGMNPKDYKRLRRDGPYCGPGLEK